MFNNSEKFAIIKAAPSKLKIELEEIFKNHDDFFIEEQSARNLESQIVLISKTKFKGDAFVIWEPLEAEGYLIFYSNYLDGWYSLLYILFKRYQREVLMISLGSTANKGHIGFYFYSYEKERVVRALYDETKWTFFEKGEPLDFENENYYKKKRITDRMNNGILIEYLLNWGIDISNKNFYESQIPILSGNSKS